MKNPFHDKNMHNCFLTNYVSINIFMVKVRKLWSIHERHGSTNNKVLMIFITS